MTPFRIATVTLALAVAASLAAPAFAASVESQEQTALLTSRLTLVQAIAIAEQRTGGKAYDAGVTADHDTLQVVVETNGPKGVQTVTMDAGSGTILGTHAGGVDD